MCVLPCWYVHFWQCEHTNRLSMHSARADLVQRSVANDPLLPRREPSGPAVTLLSEATGKPSEVW